MCVLALFFFFSSRKLIFLLCCRLSRSLARAPRVFCQKEKEYFRLPPFLLLLPTLLLLLLPLGLEHQLVRHQGGWQDFDQCGSCGSIGGVNAPYRVVEDVTVEKLVTAVRELAGRSA